MRNVPWTASAVIFSKGSRSLQVVVVNAEETHDHWQFAQMLEIKGRFCRNGDECVGARSRVGFN